MPKVSVHLYMNKSDGLLSETVVTHTPVPILDLRYSSEKKLRSVRNKSSRIRESEGPLSFPKADQYSISRYSSPDTVTNARWDKLPRVKVGQRQRRMSVKLAEWLDQYNQVSQRQQDYLDKIQQLRKSLQHKSDNGVIMNIEGVRNADRLRNRQRRIPVAGLARMEDSAVRGGPEAFPSRPYVLNERNNSKFHMAPNITPRRLAPIVKKVKVQQQIKSEEDSQDSPRPDLGGAKMRTDYESFESIAKRNKLNLTQFFNSSFSHRAPKTNKRLPLTVSTVTVMDAVTEDEYSPSSMEYITDLSSRKAISSMKGIPEHLPD